jgi:hypothetical protein
LIVRFRKGDYTWNIRGVVFRTTGVKSMTKKVEYGFVPAGADAASAELKRQPVGAEALVFRFPGGILSANPGVLSNEIASALMFHGLKQVLADTGAGREPGEFEALARKRWETLASGQWGAERESAGPRMTEKSAAVTVYARMKGISTDAATAIYEGKQADPLGVTWDAARRKAFLGKFAADIAAERGRTAEQEF